jgi:hypothetical protein
VTDVDQAAALAFAEAARFAPRSPERRAACHAWSALITSPTVGAAKRAIATFGTERTQAAALELLERIANEATETKGEPR